MFKQLVLVTGLLASGVVMAEPVDKWIEVTRVENGSSITYANPSRMKIIDNKQEIVELWEKRLYLKDILERKIKKDDYYLNKLRLNCINQQQMYLSLTFYSKDSPQTIPIPYPTWNDVLPDSTGEGELITVCEFMFPKAETAAE